MHTLRPLYSVRRRSTNRSAFYNGKTKKRTSDRAHSCGPEHAKIGSRSRACSHRGYRTYTEFRSRRDSNRSSPTLIRARL